MADRERVIKALRIHRERTVCANEEGEVCSYFSYDDCYHRLTNDALELLLKESAQEAQRDYEAASNMRDYCEHYEPTYNPDDGSM